MLMGNNNSLFTNAIRMKKIERTPIWIMRQAGRYLPEYRKLRDKYDFMTVCKTPELAAEVTLQPIRRFEFDAAILFSDILVIPEAMGQHLEFLEDHGPQLSPKIINEKEFRKLRPDNLTAKLSYVEEAVRLIRRELNDKIPLIGFCGSPFTLATYMIEGKPTRNFKFIKEVLYSNPQFLHELLELLTESVVEYLKMQIEAGAQVIQVFDTWGGILPPHQFHEFSAKYLIRIIENLKAGRTPVILFSKGGIKLLQQLKESGADMLGVDWMTDMKEARDLVNGRFALQGNLDPTVLYGHREIIKKETIRILEIFRDRNGHVFNLGHGILPDIPVENVQYLVDTVRESSYKMYK